MNEQVFWYSRRKARPVPPLRGEVSAEAVVVGGGIAGLSAAQRLIEIGVSDVVLLEAKFCGAGASGKSSGFITPDSELELYQLERRFGPEDARLLWSSAMDGCETIRRNIETFGLDCGMVEADGFYAANGDEEFSIIEEEHDAHTRLGFESRLYRKEEIGRALGSVGFAGGARYPGCFAIDSFGYVQGLKDALVERGLRVFENSPAVELCPNGVVTPNGGVNADKIFLCLDKYAPELDVARSANYHAQTFIVVSRPLTGEQMERLFPDRSLIVWDTDLIYQYFRPTDDGRLLIGGGLLRETYSHGKSHSPRSVDHLLEYVREKFPYLAELEYEYFWPGMIGVTKDLLPLAGQSPDTPSHFYAMCSAGLPWSTLAGRVAVDRAMNGETVLDRFFSPDRAFNFIEPVQSIVGKPATFALSHYYAKNYQTGDAEAASRRRDLSLVGLCVAAFVGGVGLGRKIKTKLRS